MKCHDLRVVNVAGRDKGQSAQIMTDLTDPDPNQAIKTALVQLLPKLRRFCLALTASPADADDLCQSTLERAITRLDQWVPGTRLDSWLYRMAQNLHKNTVRDRSNRLRLLDEQATDVTAVGDDVPLPSNDAEASEVRRHVLALPQTHREVLILICVEGYSYKECAEHLGLPPTTVTNRLFQARMLLRKTMEGDAPDDDASDRRASA